MTLFKPCLVLGFMLIWQVNGYVLPLLSAEPLAAPMVEIQDYLRKMIVTETSNRQFICRGELICTAPLIPQFYERRNFQPAWSSNGQPGAQAAELFAFLANVDAEGLRPADYHLFSIKFLLERLDRLQGEGKVLTPEELVDLDLLLTDAFLLCGSHLLNGRTNPEDIGEQWNPDDHPPDLAIILEQALASDGVTIALQGLRPPHSGYRMLMAALAEMVEIADRGGWPVVGTGFNLAQNMRHRRVYALRQRLMVSGDYEASDLAEDNLFDEALAEAVRRFQQRHGLKDDGIVGPETLAALNVPVESRLRQIKANLERWRWLPHDLGQRYILVSIADFSLRVIENSHQIMEMRVVVGQPLRSTPVFSDMVEYLVINPYWYLPETIIVEDVAPNIRDNPAYLAQKGIKVFAAGSDETQEVAPSAIDWAGLSKENLPYKLRQEPGSLNALGRVKIIFPNKYSIYLHDTPSQELFQKTSRDFSSGCIRGEKPIELVSYLLRNDPFWSSENILRSLASGKRQLINLPEQIPIHILYWTAWGDEDGQIHFRRDIYDRDKLLAAALDGMAKRP